MTNIQELQGVSAVSFGQFWIELPESMLIHHQPSEMLLVSIIKKIFANYILQRADAEQWGSTRSIDSGTTFFDNLYAKNVFGCVIQTCFCKSHFPELFIDNNSNSGIDPSHGVSEPTQTLRTITHSVLA